MGINLNIGKTTGLLICRTGFFSFSKQVLCYCVLFYSVLLAGTIPLELAYCAKCFTHGSNDKSGSEQLCGDHQLSCRRITLGTFVSPDQICTQAASTRLARRWKTISLECYHHCSACFLPYVFLLNFIFK